MKNLIFLLTTLMSVMTFAQNGKTDVENESLKGKVKSLKHTRYSVKDFFGNIEKDSIMQGENYTFLFNTDGKFLETTYYNIDNTISHKNLFSYNDKKQFIESQQVDEKGELLAKYIPKYNGKAQIEEYNTYNKNGELSDKSIYKYDKEGNYIEENAYYADGEKIYQYLYTYDKKARLIESKYSHFEENLIQNTKFEYDNQGKHIKTNRITTDLENKFQYKVIFKFNDKEDELDFEVFDEKNKPDGKVHYIYEYDNQNNWIKRTTMEGFITTDITEREITYYE